MAEDQGPAGDGGGLPPKLDLRKSGVLKPAPEAGGASVPKPAAAAIPKPVPTTVKPIAAATPKPSPTTVKPIAAATPKPAPTTVKPVGAEAKPAADDAQTMRLVVQEEDGDSAAAPQPVAGLKPSPKLTPKPVPTTVKPAGVEAPVAPKDSEAMSQTMRLVVPEEKDDASEAKTLVKKPAVKTAVKPMAPGDPKRETSKIPLDAAKPAPGAAGPKTIRISPAKNAAVAQMAAADAEGSDDDKRKTSRISLEAALAPDGDGAAAGAPKTIKIKKPSDSSTIKAAKGPSIKAAIDDLSKTARLDDVTDDDAGPVTRKKTIKVKRPTQRPGVQRTVKAVRPGTEGGAAVEPQAGEAGPVPAAPGLMSVQAEEKMNPFFPICAILAALIMIVTVYMFCAQAFGPNVSLTQLSYWPSGPDLAWPGKLKAYMMQ